MSWSLPLTSNMFISGACFSDIQFILQSFTTPFPFYIMPQYPNDQPSSPARLSAPPHSPSLSNSFPRRPQMRRRFLGRGLRRWPCLAKVSELRVKRASEESRCNEGIGIDIYLDHVSPPGSNSTRLHSCAWFFCSSTKRRQTARRRYSSSGPRTRWRWRGAPGFRGRACVGRSFGRLGKRRRWIWRLGLGT